MSAFPGELIVVLRNTLMTSGIFVRTKSNVENKNAKYPHDHKDHTADYADAFKAVDA
jgi:hypothetical protein